MHRTQTRTAVMTPEYGVSVCNWELFLTNVLLNLYTFIGVFNWESEVYTFVIEIIYFMGKSMVQQRFNEACLQIALEIHVYIYTNL